MLQDPGQEIGFICNLENHWFSLRKIHGMWLDLNSVEVEPKIVSEFYLGMFLAQLINDGYSIWSVRGTFPPMMQIQSVFGSLFKIQEDGKILKTSMEEEAKIQEEAVNFCESMLLSLEEPSDAVDVITLSVEWNQILHLRCFRLTDLVQYVLLWLQQVTNHSILASEMSVSSSTGDEIVPIKTLLRMKNENSTLKHIGLTFNTELHIEE